MVTVITVFNIGDSDCEYDRSVVVIVILVMMIVMMIVILVVNTNLLTPEPSGATCASSSV